MVILFEVPIFNLYDFWSRKVIFHIQFNQNKEVITCTVFNHFMVEYFSIFRNTRDQ